MNIMIAAVQCCVRAKDSASDLNMYFPNVFLRVIIEQVVFFNLFHCRLPQPVPRV